MHIWISVWGILLALLLIILAVVKKKSRFCRVCGADITHQKRGGFLCRKRACRGDSSRSEDIDEDCEIDVEKIEPASPEIVVTIDSPPGEGSVPPFAPVSRRRKEKNNNNNNKIINK